MAIDRRAADAEGFGDLGWALPALAAGPGRGELVGVRHDRAAAVAALGAGGGDLLREYAGSAERALAAARAVIIESPDKAGYQMLCRQAALAVELCQRVAELAGQVLRGSYRPGSMVVSGFQAASRLSAGHA